MLNQDLKHKAVSGIIWSGLQRYSTILIQFFSGIILARLLTPYDYGCIGMLMIFVSLSESFIDAGFDSALIQKKRPTQEDYSTIFFWNLGMAVFLYLVLYFSAPAIARFYGIPLLSDVLRVQGIILFIYAFNIVQRNQLRKRLNFKVLSVVTVITSILSLMVTITMAYHGYGVWSLVSQHILTALIPALFFWFYIKWRPICFFSWQSFKELFSFGAFMFLTHLVNQFSLQLRGLLIGRLYSPVILGYFSKANSTEGLASKSISQVLTQVTYPLYAEVQDDKERLRTIIKQLSSFIAYFTFPLLTILILVAKPVFILLYSDRWIDSIPYFQILCLVGIGVCLQSVNLQVISAIGKSKTMFIWALVKQSVGLILAVGGLFLFGIYGLLWGAVAHSWFCTYVNMSLVARHIDYGLINQFNDLLPIAFFTSLSFVVSYLIGNLLDLSIYIGGIVEFSIFIIVYLGCSVVIKPPCFLMICDYLKKAIHK